MDFLPIKRAIVSVTDKSGLVELCTALNQGNVQIVSTGGTARKISEQGLPVTQVNEVTNFPEILGGRVKTLHPRIHAGVLADKDNPDHLQTLKEQEILFFDLICVNLYNFQKALSKGLELKELIEEIDIGGPTLLRAGAKNLHSIAVLPGAEYYPEFIAELKKNDFKVSLDFRKRMAAKTFSLVSEYDALIAKALSEDFEP